VYLNGLRVNSELRVNLEQRMDLFDMWRSTIASRRGVIRYMYQLIECIGAGIRNNLNEAKYK
jgi:hypothetical protein